MSNDSTIVDNGALTLVWKTLGIEDRSVEEARTMTMRADLRPCDSSPDDLVQKLPPLLRNNGSDTLPELRFKGTLGEGGMGLVELAEQLSVGRDVAVKKIRHESKSDRATLILLREGWTTGLLEHPNIVPVYTLGRNDDDEPVIVMKKIAGTSWLALIGDQSRAPESFDMDDPIEVHIEIMSQVCNAVHYAHSRGIIHRDLKPENVMLGSFGEVYVLDWGIAVSLKDDATGRLAQAKDVSMPAGTPAYMAPEMVDGDGEKLGVHTDVFLLGAMLYEALTGEPPYSGQTLFAIMMNAHECAPPAFDDSVPTELAAICRRAMARNPEERFQSAREFRDALSEYRRHRESRRLCVKGNARLQGVEQFLDREQNGEEIDESTLYKTFGECRFAYEQALEITADHIEALDGLQRALELMATRALQRDAYKAASLLIADFPQPRKAYQDRLKDLNIKLTSRQEDYEELQQIRHAVDANIGRGSRTIFLLIMGAIWIVLSFALAVSVHASLVEVTHSRMFAHIVLLTAVLAGVIFAGRHRFFENEVNRRMIGGVLTLFVFTTCLRGIVWLLEVPYATALNVEILMYAMGLFLLAIALDRRLAVGGFPFLLAAIAGALWPPMLLWFFASANAVGVALLVWVWWPENGNDKVCITSNVADQPGD